jgi:hypothetical protein
VKRREADSRQAIIGTGLTLALFAAAARADAVPTATVTDLCTASETVVFSCAVARRRVVSVCASSALSPTEGYMQYRFGTRARLEAAVPKDVADANDWRGSVESRSLMFAGGGGAYLRFNSAPYAYVTYSAIGRGWPEKRGVMTMKGDAMIANYPCVGKYRSILGAALFRNAGIAEDRVELELP